MYYIRFGDYPNHMHIQLIVKKSFLKKKQKIKKRKRETQQHGLGTNVRVRGFKAGLLARSQFASGRSCNRPTQSRFSVVFLGPRANAELIPKFHVAVHTCHATLPIITSKFRPALR
jgi:hypothetical protein